MRYGTILILRDTFQHPFLKKACTGKEFVQYMKGMHGLGNFDDSEGSCIIL